MIPMVEVDFRNFKSRLEGADGCVSCLPYGILVDLSLGSQPEVEALRRFVSPLPSEAFVAFLPHLSLCLSISKL
jgi:hypothetical protein